MLEVEEYSNFIFIFALMSCELQMGCGCGFGVLKTGTVGVTKGVPDIIEYIIDDMRYLSIPC